MKPTQKQFAIFKKECEVWLDKFQLGGWSVRIVLGTKTKNLADTYRNLQSYVATISMNAGWNKECNPLTEEGIKDAAKHEVIHLLLGRLAYNGLSRFVTQDDMIESEEELVNKLSLLL